jgi:hypothetical protein
MRGIGGWPDMPEVERVARDVARLREVMTHYAKESRDYIMLAGILEDYLSRFTTERSPPGFGPSGPVQPFGR